MTVLCLCPHCRRPVPFDLLAPDDVQDCIRCGKQMFGNPRPRPLSRPPRLKSSIAAPPPAKDKPQENTEDWQADFPAENPVFSAHEQELPESPAAICPKEENRIFSLLPDEDASTLERRLEDRLKLLREARQEAPPPSTAPEATIPSAAPCAPATVLPTAKALCAVVTETMPSPKTILPQRREALRSPAEPAYPIERVPMEARPPLAKPYRKMELEAPLEAKPKSSKGMWFAIFMLGVAVASAAAWGIPYLEPLWKAKAANSRTRPPKMPADLERTVEDFLLTDSVNEFISFFRNGASHARAISNTYGSANPGALPIGGRLMVVSEPKTLHGYRVCEVLVEDDVGKEISMLLVHDADGWKVDWPSFCGIGEMSVENFLKSHPTEPTRLLVFAKPLKPGRQDKNQPVRFLLADSRGQQTILAEVPVSDSAVFALAREIASREWEGAFQEKLPQDSQVTVDLKFVEPDPGNGAQARVEIVALHDSWFTP